MYEKINQTAELLRQEMILAKKAKEGWNYSGKEKLTLTKYFQGKFNEFPFQNESDLIKKYSGDGAYEVDLVLDEYTQKLEDIKRTMTEEEFKDFLKNLRDEEKNYFVFIRPKKKD